MKLFALIGIASLVVGCAATDNGNATVESSNLTTDRDHTTYYFDPVPGISADLKAAIADRAASVLECDRWEVDCTVSIEKDPRWTASHSLTTGLPEGSTLKVPAGTTVMTLWVGGDTAETLFNAMSTPTTDVTISQLKGHGNHVQRASAGGFVACARSLDDEHQSTYCAIMGLTSFGTNGSHG